MAFDFVALGIIVVSVIVLGVVISRKFPVIASINTEQLQKNRQDKVKKGIIENRLKRKLSAMQFISLFKGKDEDGGGTIFSRMQRSLKDIEHKYRTRIREIEPAEEESAEKQRMVLLAEAKSLADEEKYKDAENKYIEAISIDSKLTDAYEGLAELYKETKDHEHAKEIYEHLLRTHATTEEGDTSKSDVKPEAGSVVSLNAEVADYHVELGEIHLVMGDTEKAIMCFKEAAKLEPNNPRILDLLIETAVTLEDKELATIHLKKLQESNPENEKLTEFKKAIKQLK